MLKSDGTLSYSKGPEDKDENEIPLTGYACDRADDKTGKPFSLGLTGAGKNFFLYAETESDITSWINAIRSALNGGSSSGGDDFVVPTEIQKKKVSMDDFTLLKVLGRGGFGKVVLVRKKDTKQLVGLRACPICLMFSSHK